MGINTKQPHTNIGEKIFNLLGATYSEASNSKFQTIPPRNSDLWKPLD